MSWLARWRKEWREDVRWEPFRQRELAWRARQPGYWLCLHTLAPRWRLYRWILGHRAARVCRVLWWGVRWRWHFRLRRWRYTTRQLLGLSVDHFHARGEG